MSITSSSDFAFNVGTCSQYFDSIESKERTDRDLKRDIKFHYGDANYTTFQSEHVVENLSILGCGQALGNAVYSVAQAVCRIAFSVFLILPALCCDDRPFLANLYSAGRDVEAAAGWIVKICNDTLGSYMIEEGNFQKKCYDFSENYFPGFANIGGVNIRNLGLSMSISLLQFRDMDLEERDSLIEELDLTQDMERINQNNLDFFQRLNSANAELLETLTLLDLQRNVNNPSVRYALLSDDELRNLDITDPSNVFSELSSVGTGVLFKRLQAYSDSSNGIKTSIISFYRAPGALLSQNIEKIPAALFGILKEEQIATMDFSRASEKQIRELIPNYLGYDTQEARQRLSCVKNINQIFQFLPYDQHILLSDEHYLSLDTSKLTQKEVNSLFPALTNDEIVRESSYQRIDTHSVTLGQMMRNETLVDGTQRDNVLGFLDPIFGTQTIVSGLTIEESREIAEERCSRSKIYLLSQEQLEHIQDKLRPEYLTLLARRGQATELIEC